MKFSISVPVGAWHPFLPACLESLVAQGDLVEIAFLDASGDDRVKVVADKYHDHFAWRRHGPDKGQSDAIGEGWRHTKGDFIGWLNADDILMPGALAKVAARLAADPQIDALYGHSTILDEAGRMTGYHWSVEPPGDRLYEGGIISQPSCFFRRSVYEATGGIDLSLHYTMDWDLFIRMYRSGAKFAFIDEVLSMVLWGDDTKTASFNARRREELQQIIRTYAPAEKQKKIFRSFAIQNVLSRLQPAILREAVTRALVRGRKVINGLAADGAIADAAEIVLAHYDDSAKTGVRLYFDNADAVGDVDIDAPAQITREAKAIVVTAPFPAGEMRRIRISAAAGKTARFKAAEWV